MTNEELQTVIAAVIQALKTNGKTIAQLTPVTSLADSDCLEVGGGKKIAFSKLKELVASAVVVTEESIKSWVVIESTDDLPEEPTPAEQEKAYVLAEGSTLYVYVGEGGDTLDGSYKSVTMKGADGAPGEKGDKGDSGVDLGEVVLVNDLTTGGEGNALSAEMGKELNDRMLINGAYSRVVYPAVFGNYYFSASALTSNGGFFCSQPFLVKKGETVKSGVKAKYCGLAIVAEENLPLTPSTPITRVDDTGGTARFATYTNNTGADIYMIWTHDKAICVGVEISQSGSAIFDFGGVSARLDALEGALSQPNIENVVVNNFIAGGLYVYNSGVNVGKFYYQGNSGLRITTPIRMKKGDTLHIECTSGTYLIVARIADNEVQSESTLYDGLRAWSSNNPVTHAIVPVDEDMRVVFTYTVNDLQSVYIEHASSEMIEPEVVYPTLADDCIVENADSDLCLIMGSSLTHNDYSPKSMSWIERVNDLVDIGIVNGGHSGANLSGNITDMTTGTINLLGVSLKSLRPRYIVSNNDANSTPTGKNLDTLLKQFERIAKSVGATCLVCGEEPTLINAANYHNQAAMTKQGVNYFPSAMLWYNLNRTQSYAGWMDGSQHVHSNAKNGSSHVSMVEMLSQLYIHKSVKFYKVRENYKDGSPTTAQLAYTSNTERAAIWRGTCPAIGNGTSPWANDNIDGTGYIDGETPGIDKMTDTNITSEVATAKAGGAVTFYKHALVEIITPRVQVSKAQVAIECSAEPTAVGYISNGTYVTLTPTYAGGVITIDLNSADIQDYDKIRIVVSDTTDETFTLGKVKAILFDGESKPSYEVRYKGRKVGTELMSKTSVESGWTMTGNASVKQLPSAVRNYTSLNNVANHIQLDDDAASASYTQSLDKVVHKVAVRIAATIFPPIQTKRTSNDYTTTEQNLFRGMYYGGDLLLTINGAYIPLHIEFGWTEVYAEAIIDGNSLNLSLGRATAFDPENYNVGDFPVLIHNVSVQEIS